jgi:hypothetical protein
MLASDEANDGALSPVVSWPAIFGGTVAALALWFVLAMLGSGFGLAWAAPFSNSGPSAQTLTIVAVIWLIVTQWIAGGIGGYLTGRLRTKWVGTHTHEVFFRDTAHGFLTWSLGTVIGITVLATASTALVGTGLQAAGTAGAGAASAAIHAPDAVNAYAVEKLFRPVQPATGSLTTPDLRADAARIITQSVANGKIADADRTYLAQLVAGGAGVSPADAQKRVDDAIAQSKDVAAMAAQAADMARAAAAKFSIFSGVSMLIGAFIACSAAAIGGRQRDLHP